VENLIIPGAADSRPETSSFSNKVPINRYNFHPTVKPVELMSYLVELFSIEGAIVLDPYMGSASSGIACLQKNLKFIRIESSLV
jgi:DNA modification methylase